MSASTHTPGPNGRQVCPNCNATLSCACQKKRATDGKELCVHCLYAYETALKITNR